MLGRDSVGHLSPDWVMSEDECHGTFHASRHTIFGALSWEVLMQKGVHSDPVAMKRTDTIEGVCDHLHDIEKLCAEWKVK